MRFIFCICIFFFTFNIFLFILEPRDIGRVKDTAFHFKGIFFSYKSAITIILKVQKTAKLSILLSDHGDFNFDLD